MGLICVTQRALCLELCLSPGTMVLLLQEESCQPLSHFICLCKDITEKRKKWNGKLRNVRVFEGRSCGEKIGGKIEIQGFCIMQSLSSYQRRWEKRRYLAKISRSTLFTQPGLLLALALHAQLEITFVQAFVAALVQIDC